MRWFPYVIVASWLAMAVLGPWLPLEPDKVDLPNILQGPVSGAWLGYDDLGRPIWDRLVMGAQTSLYVAVWVMVISFLIGTFIGSVSAYVGGWVDLVVVRVIDIFLAVPGILLAIAFAGVMGPGVENVVIALSIVGWVGYARLSRAQIMALKQRDHVVAAVSLGTRPMRIINRHLLPLISAPLIVEATFGIAGVVIAEAGLSFLGLGVQPPEASWGSMIRDGTRYMLVAPHMVLVPGIAMMLVVLAVNLLGDQLRDRLDVRSRDRR
ncbi:MAG: ABC transporter permease [Gammaproteobacteria bacterium]|nr:ABC transporter permease [Gammaproteobacteria bacterium]